MWCGHLDDKVIYSMDSLFTKRTIYVTMTGIYKHYRRNQNVRAKGRRRHINLFSTEVDVRHTHCTVLRKPSLSGDRDYLEEETGAEYNFSAKCTETQWGSANVNHGAGMEHTNS